MRVEMGGGDYSLFSRSWDGYVIRFHGFRRSRHPVGLLLLLHVPVAVKTLQFPKSTTKSMVGVVGRVNRCRKGVRRGMGGQERGVW